jgi:hypothetical protein
MRSDSATAVKTAVIRTMRPRGRDAPRRGLAGGGVAPDCLPPVRGLGRGSRSERAPRSLERVFAGWMEIRSLTWLL